MKTPYSESYYHNTNINNSTIDDYKVSNLNCSQYFYCSTSNQERVINFVLATIFTAPYVLLKMLFEPCTKSYLANGLKIKNI